MKVCILGSGLTSLSLAKTLINEGLRVDLFSNNVKNIYDNSQTLGISKNNIDFFNSNILNIDKLLWNIHKIEIFSDNLINEKILNFESEKEQLFSVISNHKLFNYLFTELKKNKNFTIKKNKNVIELINDYDLIINSDFNHPITKKFFYNKLSKDYNSYGYTTVVDHKKLKFNNVATQIFTKNGPLAFLPISENKTSIVYSLRGNGDMNKKKLEEFIHKNFKKIKIDKIHDFKSFKLKSLNLRSYYYKNILAFGDLLHRIHPLAGQGFNMTLRDIKVLIELIKYNLNLGIQLDSSVCVGFEMKSKSQNYLFSNGIDLIYEFFNLESKTKTKLMSKSVQFLGKNKSLNKLFTKLADTGISI